MKKFGFIIILVLLELNCVVPAAGHEVMGFVLNSPLQEQVRGCFIDPDGNRLFLCTSGDLNQPGHALILRFDWNGEDTLMRTFSGGDTSGVLFSGFRTAQLTYIFIGVKSRDTMPCLNDFCLLWLLETDTLLNTIASNTYDIFQGYQCIQNLFGVHDPVSGGYLLAGNVTGPDTSWYRDDIFLVSMDQHGSMLQTKILKRPLLNRVESVFPNPDGSVSLITTGMAANSWLQRLSINASLTILEQGSLETDPFVSHVSTAYRKTDTTYLLVYSRNFPDVVCDVVVDEFHENGQSIRQFVMGEPDEVDIPSGLVSLIPVNSQAYYLCGTMNTGNVNGANRIRVVKLNEDLDLIWEKDFQDEEHYDVRVIQPGDNQSGFIAAGFYNTDPIENHWGLYFFQLDSAGPSGISNSFIPVRNNKFNVFPNPGSDQFSVENLEPGISRIRIWNEGLKEIMKVQQLKNGEKINTSGLSPGIFFIEITSERGVVSFVKWIKKN